ncbi:IS66 family insertion sequence element accessory protein TnpB [Shewanella sp. SNU WT4]|uniref:IS66 family insertion sequence element accessory protein TnpB n=1 Tax=Shewanella sp. SNU WT4 TaxID=2590015 RepID=UPI00112A8398|nr:IS66 family insertion sequence element accessory protein TnpB [Shewanella sp. SNU WT4]QDF66971.1 IS66 family insertion sequence element accessory protein TnpB [Shewanella sp. SNU WT4]
MTTHKTSQQWRQLLLQRNTFSGTNIEFCQQHNVSITTYYKQRALLGKQQYQPSVSEQTSHATQSRFIQLNNRLLNSQFPHHPNHLIGCDIPNDARRRAESVAKILMGLFKTGSKQ